MDRYVELEAVETWYREAERTRGWKDFLSRINQLREVTFQALVNGSLDKFGNSHDDEYRAVLVCLDRILGFRPEIATQYENLRKRKEDQEKRAESSKGKIHGNDFIGPGYSNRLLDRNF